MSDDRYNFLNGYKLYEAASEKDLLRPEMERIHFLGGFAYATDAHILVRVPLSICTSFEPEEAAELNGFCIHRKLLKMIYGFDRVKIERTMTAEDAYGNLLEDAQVVVYITVVFQGQQIRFRLERSNLPFVEQFEKILQSEGERRPLSRIGLNTRLLSKVSAAMNMELVSMDFTTESNKIYITSTNALNSGAMAIIMPVMVSGTLPGMGDEDESEESSDETGRSEE